MALRRSHRSRGTHDDTEEPKANMQTRSARKSRATAFASISVSVSRSPLNSDEPKRSLRLTVKMPSDKLREATGSGRTAGRRSVNVFREDPIVSGPRSSRNRKRVVEVESSDDDDIDNQEEDEVDDEDAPDDDEDADADADGDIDMDDTPPQPPSRHNRAPLARAKPPKSVEAKEMEMEEDEDGDEEEGEELDSDSDEDAEGEVDDQDELTIADATGDGLDDDLDEDELEGDMDSDALALNQGKTTKRQRGNLGNDFLQLPMEPQVKKHLTAEERQMRRAEMARRRKNLSEKRNEEEKMDTINRLLKKQAPKRRGRVAANEAGDGTPRQEFNEPDKVDPTLVRWISGPNGCKVSVPEEWLGTPAGRMFGAPVSTTGKMVEEL